MAGHLLGALGKLGRGKDALGDVVDPTLENLCARYELLEAIELEP